jgi:hypothetical protein
MDKDKPHYFVLRLFRQELILNLIPLPQLQNNYAVSVYFIEKALEPCFVHECQMTGMILDPDRYVSRLTVWIHPPPNWCIVCMVYTAPSPFPFFGHGWPT